MAHPFRRTNFALHLLCTVAIASGLAATPVASAQTAQKPVALISVSSIDELLQDFNFACTLVGQDQLAAQAQMMVGGFTQGLDSSKPIGLVVQTDGMNPGGALCLPVTDVNAIMNMVQAFGGTAEDKPGGIKEISAQGQTMFAKEGSGWLYLSMMPQMLEGLPADPAALFADLNKEYDLGVRLHVQNIPEAYREMAIAQLQQGMEAGFQQSGQSPEEIAASKEMAQLQVQQIKQLVNESDQVTFGVALDGTGQRALIDFAMTAVPGSDLAKQMVQQGTEQKTNFAGFFQPDAAMMMSFASKVLDTDKAQIEQVFQVASKQAKSTFDKESDEVTEEQKKLVHSAIDDFLMAFKSSLEAGIIDGGMVMNMAPNSMTLVAGGFVGDPTKIESGVKKLEQLVKQEKPDLPGITWNAESHGDVKFHTMLIPIPEDEAEPRQLFGDQLSMAIGIGSKSAFFALGRDSVQAVKSIIDASAAEGEKTVPPFEVTFALKQIMSVAATMAKGEEKADLQNIANMLETQATGRDHIRIVMQPIENGVRYRLEAEEGVLRTIGMAAEASQKQEAAAGF